MKLCFLSPSYPPRIGGMEIYVQKLATGLVGRGHEVTLVTTDRGLNCGYRYERDEGVHIIRYPARPKVLGVALQPLLGFKALNLDFDLVHIHSLSPAVILPLPIFRLFKRRPAVLSSYFDPVLSGVESWGVLGEIVTKAYTLLMRGYISLANELVALSQEHTAASPVLGSVWTRVQIIAPGVDLKAFSPRRQDSENLEVIFIGRLAPYKGVEYLLRAMKIVFDTIPGSTLKIVGDGPDRSRLIALAARLGLDGKAVFINAVEHDKIPELIDQAYLLVLPSLRSLESFGIVILEAFACGKPVVATDIPGPSGLVKGVGVQVPPRDVQRMAEAIIKLLSDTELARDLGRMGRSVAQRYPWEKVIDLHENLYRRLLSNGQDLSP